MKLQAIYLFVLGFLCIAAFSLVEESIDDTEMRNAMASQLPMPFPPGRFPSRCISCPFRPCACPFGYYCRYTPRTCFSCSFPYCVRAFPPRPFPSPFPGRFGDDGWGSGGWWRRLDDDDRRGNRRWRSWRRFDDDDWGRDRRWRRFDSDDWSRDRRRRRFDERDSNDRR